MGRQISRPVALLLSLALALIWSMSSRAGAAEPTLEIAEVDTTNHPDVSLVVTAPAELATADIESIAFAVEEAGAPRPSTVERISTEGLEVVVVIDSSGSMQGAPIDAARAAAATFVRALPDGVPTAVVAFGAAPVVAQPFSTDVDGTVAAIGAILPSGETALYDALLAASSMPSDDRATRRAIVVLSDGGDTVSTASIGDALAALETSNAAASVVELVTEESDRGALQRIADVTGGRVVSATDPAGLASAFDAVRADLVGRYRIGYRSTAGGETPLVLTLRAGTRSLRTSTVLDLPSVPVTAAPRPSAPTTVGRDPGLFGDAALLVGGGLVFIALATLLLGLARPPRRTVRLADGPAVVSTAKDRNVTKLVSAATLVAERTLERNGRRRAVENLLEQAGIAMRAAEVLVITTSSSFALLALGALVLHPIVGLVLAVVPLAAVLPVLRMLARRRQQAFADQLDGLLQMLAGGLRAGYGLLQAIETAGRELDGPAGEELRRFTTEVRLGRDVADGLDALAVRAGNEDFAWVVHAIRIHREVGGDLAEVLDRVSETIRDRGRLRRQVRALSAEGRISAYVLLALPIVVLLGMTVLNRAFVAPLFTTAPGNAMLGLSAVLMTVGALWIKRLIRPVF